MRLLKPHIHYKFKVCREDCKKTRPGLFEYIIMIQAVVDILFLALLVKAL